MGLATFFLPALLGVPEHSHSHAAEVLLCSNHNHHSHVLHLPFLWLVPLSYSSPLAIPNLWGHCPETGEKSLNRVRYPQRCVFQSPRPPLYFQSTSLLWAVTRANTSSEAENRETVTESKQYSRSLRSSASSCLPGLQTFVVPVSFSLSSMTTYIQTHMYYDHIYVYIYVIYISIHTHTHTNTYVAENFSVFKILFSQRIPLPRKPRETLFQWNIRW